jgi:hypothetical protein
MTSLLIAGISFEASDPYTEGHCCTAVEAAVLNDARHSNIKVNFSKKIKDRIENDVQQDFSVEFAAYDAAYQFTPLLRRPSDPVGRAAYAIAADLVLAKLRERGQSKSDLEDGLFDSHVARVADLPRIRAEAARRVEATKTIVADALDLNSEGT